MERGVNMYFVYNLLLFFIWLFKNLFNRCLWLKWLVYFIYNILLGKLKGNFMVYFLVVFKNVCFVLIFKYYIRNNKIFSFFFYILRLKIF